MRTALTGTPGTGKTTVGNILAQQYGKTVVHLHDIIIQNHYYINEDQFRDSLIVDIASLQQHKFSEECIIEGHLAHYLQVDLVIILRTNPIVLKKRLYRKGFSEPKIAENVEAEILDVILTEAIQMHEYDKVYEVDSSGIVETTVEALLSITHNANREKFRPGKFDWTGYLH